MFLPILSIIIAFVSYLKIFFGFFIQDEWLSFAYNYTLYSDKTAIAASFAPSAGHYQPLNTLVLYILFLIFKVNYLPYAIISLVLHLLCVFLVYVLAKKVFDSDKLAFMTSTLFGVIATTYQATAWVMADLGTHFSTIFALISLILFYDFLKKRDVKHFIRSLFFLIISLLFKENAIGLFAFYPIVYFLFCKRNKINYKYPIIIFATGFFYFVLRVIMVFLPSSYVNNTVALKSQSLIIILYNILSFPVKALLQVITPSRYLIGISDQITTMFSQLFVVKLSATDFNRIAEHRVLDGLSFAIFLIIIGLCYVLVRKSKEIIDGKKFLTVFLFIILNGFIFGLAPERIGIVSDLDSRDLYFVSIGVVFLLVLILQKVFKSNIRAVFVVFGLIFVINFVLLNNRLSMLTDDASIRKSILNQVMSDNPVLPPKVVFYTESDKAFYGLPSEQKVLPFQSGFGQTLLVTYFESQKLPIGMFSGRFLWDITEQGYRQIGDRGFGYFRDFDYLRKTLKDNKLPIESVIAYKYYSDTNSFINITNDVRQKLKTK